MQEALSSFVNDEWMKEMNDEMKSMRTNQIWDLVDLPSRQKAIGFLKSNTRRMDQ